MNERNQVIGPKKRLTRDPLLPSLPSVQDLLALGVHCGETIIGFAHSPSRNRAPARTLAGRFFRVLVLSGFRDRSAATPPIEPSPAETAKPTENLAQDMKTSN
jgi:hypothetical protein